MKLEKIDLIYKNKKYSIEVHKCNSFEKFVGLMFSRRENAKNLLFNFRKPLNYPIHSFFCPEFLALWLDDKNKIVEFKFVKPWKVSIKPKKNFSKLIEIPLTSKNKQFIELLVGD